VKLWFSCAEATILQPTVASELAVQGMLWWASYTYEAYIHMLAEVEWDTLPASKAAVF
jgi:hypothetical protein